MKSISVLTVALTALIFFSCAEKTEKARGKLFIIGGGEKSDVMLRELITLADISDNDYMYVLPMASSVPDSSLIWVKDDFKDMGIKKITGHNFMPGEVPAESDLDSLRNARLIYLSGGDQSRFMSAIFNGPVTDAIRQAYKNGAVVAGTSAGAAVMSKKMITGNQKKYPDAGPGFVTIEEDNIEIAEGLGLLIDVIIDQHFIKRQRLNRLVAASIENPDQLCVGIDESTAIIVDGDEATVTGNSQVIVIKNLRKGKVVQNSLLGTEGLQLSVYLPGQRFKLK